jgi:ubiquinone/menaquinone biosynthesis C-methylase UbiE
MLRPARIDQEELLDEHDAPLADVDQSLVDLRRINRYLGGVPIYRRMVAQMSSGLQKPPVVLDLGTGTSDLLASLKQPTSMKIGLDFKIDHLVWGDRRDGIARVVADANSLPFRDASVDIITSAHFFHHFSPDHNAAMLGEALRVARAGVAVNDTRRNYLPLFFVRLLGLLRLVGRITRFDAPASVLRAYTVQEAREVAARTTAARWSVRRAIPFRFIMLLWKR